MKINEKSNKGITILAIEGNIFGGHTVRPLGEHIAGLIRNGKYKVVLDLSAVHWLNISGMGLLIGAFTALRNHKGDLKLADASEQILAELQAANLLDIFDYYPDVTAAKGGFA